MKKTFLTIICLLLIIFTLCACGDETGSRRKNSSADEVSATETLTETEVAATVATTTDAVVENFDYKTEYLNIIDVFERDFGTAPETAASVEGGLYYANLVDFDKNGTPELVLAHINNDGRVFEMKYTIYGVINGKVQCIESGDLHTTGGPDPSVNICYTEDCVYFVTGTSQSYTEKNYRKFDGEKFETVLSYSQDGYMDEVGNINCKLNGETVNYTELQNAIEEFNKTVVQQDNFFICWDMAETRERLEDTKNALKN